MDVKQVSKSDFAALNAGDRLTVVVATCHEKTGQLGGAKFRTVLLKLDNDCAFISVHPGNQKILPLLFRQVSLNGFLRWEREDKLTYLVWHAAVGTRDGKATAELMEHGHAVSAALFAHGHTDFITGVDSLVATAAAAGKSRCAVPMPSLTLKDHTSISEYYQFWGYRVGDVTNERVTLEWP